MQLASNLHFPVQLRVESESRAVWSHVLLIVTHTLLMLFVAIPYTLLQMPSSFIHS